jgi:ABC-type sugar transport system ATPase subunit
MARVSLRSVSKQFAQVDAVRDLDFVCEDREFLAILGPSGCGKSTTMRMIAGLERASSGDIYFDDQRVNDAPPARRNVAMAFEHFGLYPHMSAFGNIAYPLRIRGVRLERIVDEVMAIATALKIESFLERRPDELSGGVRQRVSLARALVRKPAVFLLDEPISHLDAGLRTEMRAELRRLHRSSGSTMIYVTHDQREALTMADRIVVMHLGRLQQIDTPDRIYRRPANRFVATFVGDPPMNLIKALITRGERGAVIVSSGGNQIASLASMGRDVPAAAAAKPIDEVEVGIRAEDLTLHEPGGGTGIPGRVRVREVIGDDVLLTVDAGNHRLRVRAPIGQDAREGEALTLRASGDRLHFFDVASGSRIESLTTN